MHALSDTALLSLWDRGRILHQVGRALLLAEAAGDTNGRDPGKLSIGERDSAIIRLRTATLGPRLHGCAHCGACDEWLEFDFDCERVVGELAPPMIEQFEVAGLRFRLPNSRDLVAAADACDAADAGRRVLQQCCLDPEGAIDWPDEFIQKVEAHIGLFDQAADIRLDFVCAGCSATWTERLDIASFFWDEIDLRAQRLLDEVHCLAMAYGWTETSILALGEQRRRAYLERCNA